MPKLSWVIMLSAFVVGGMLGWLVGNDQDAAAPAVALSATASPEASVPATAITASTPEVRVAETLHGADSIAVIDGRLSARVHDMPLASFIDAVSRAANIPIMLDPNELVSVEVTGLSRAALHDTEPGVRAAAIEEAAWRGLPSAANVVAAALADGDPSVRERALNAAVAHDVDLANDQVLRLVQTDTAPAVRLAALRAFTKSAALDRDAVRSAAQYAVNDADPSVQSTAHEILAHVTAMENTPDDFDFPTIGNNAVVLDTPADAAR